MQATASCVTAAICATAHVLRAIGLSSRARREPDKRDFGEMARAALWAVGLVLHVHLAH